MEGFLDSHVRFFNPVGGVHKEIVYDNMKVVVAKFVSKTEKEPTEESRYKNTEIEEHSKLILNHYGDLLKNSSVDFDEEALITCP